MNWSDYAQAIVALVFVLTLIGLLSIFARKFGFGSPRPTMGHKNKRVTIVEVTQVDSKRRLVLIRRDKVEHLILLGGDKEMLIEGNIEPTNYFSESKPLPRTRNEDPKLNYKWSKENPK